MEKDAQSRADLKQKGKSPKTLRQDEFLSQYKNSLFNISSACKSAKIGRRTYYSWMENDEAFKERFEDAQEERLDFLECALLKKVKEGNVIAMIFSLKCLAKKRGWVEESSLKIKPVFETMDKKRIDEIVQAGIDSEIMSRQLQIGSHKPTDD
jgi:hypothetical protein